MTTFLAELKRRRVVRAALVYVAGAFAALQAAAVLVPALHLPGWITTAIAVIAIAGLPLVLALAWTFDLTPGGGVRCTAGGEPHAAAERWLGRRTLFAVGVLLILGVGMGAGWFLRPASGRVTGGAPASPATIAVLPFQNLSADPATEPFVLGLHDDLLTQLSQLGALRVISRTSVLEYRNSPKNIRVIASELGASAVLEGGVQRAGDRVRLNVQLIDGRTDAHLWAETYDRALSAENVFAIQADIARSIARALHAELAPAEQAALAEAPTANLAALEAYHSGRAAFLSTGDPRGRIAARVFESAIELDPEFADAWAGLASARSWLVRNAELRDTAPALAALERARALAPGTVSTRLAEAYYHYYARADLPRALEMFAAVQRTAPGNLEALVGLASVQRRLNDLQEAIAHFREVARLDPLNPAHHVELAYTLAFTGELAEARALLERALRLGPDHSAGNLTYFGLLLWEIGDTAAARRFLAESVLAAAPCCASWRVELALARRDYAAALATPEFGFDRELDFFGYGSYFATNRPLLFAKAAWLARDAAAVRRWTGVALAAADSVERLEATRDAWGLRTGVHLQRALAHAFAGDTARALAAADAAARYPLERDVITGTAVLDHLIAVDILTGRHARAINRIEQLLAMPSLLKRARLRLDPIYDPLRSDPRFRALVEGAP